MVDPLARQWAGTTPYALFIEVEQVMHIIDLDEPGWATRYQALMRAPGTWVLRSKDGAPPQIVMLVHEGDQPYYTARHVGVTSSAGGNEVIGYGIGKKLPSGEVHRAWILPGGIVTMAEDIGDIGVRLVKSMGPR